ncbi:hypothetical protein REPUB_Repub16aG0106200 [Reevesia pubescens]
MAEAIVSTILEKLKTITIEKASEAWRLVTGVEKEVKRLESNFEAIQYELEDAEERQYSDKRLKHWLERFKQVSYDMEDVLDDWKTALQELQTPDEAETSTTIFVPKYWKVCDPFVSCFSFGSDQLVRRHDIATRIKEINEELDQIVKDKANFELIKREIKETKRPESTSFVDVSELLGRDAVKEDIMRILQCGTSEEEGSCNNILTISIVGMGGIGKTALAQLIYNDRTIQTHFNNRVWVSVSEPFDQIQIARAILGGLDHDSTILQKPDQLPLEILLCEIREKIERKKFLFVLDDVWTDRAQDWEQLKAIFRYGKSGSWILVTTRKESVARQMDSSHDFNLKELSEEMCWLILAQKAFAGRNRDRRQVLEDIGREIAKKCKGLPLAAKTLGGLLQDKPRREEWLNVLKSEIWRSDVAQEIFTPLLLSYYDLPSTIKKCLLYCAIFPKNYKIVKDELIQYWMAQGYLNSDDNFGGEDYFNCLASRSFFQDFEKDADRNITSCKMHDFVHDFVQFLSKHEFFIADDHSVENFTLDLSSRSARHLRLGFAKKSYFPESINGAEKLRSLIAVTHGWEWDKAFATGEALQNLFSRCKRLRLLEFDTFDLQAKQIPHGIGNLIHLRYLSLKYCSGIENLPEAVCELRNLQSLNLQYCYNLKKLPVGIGKLINLRYLCIKGCDDLTCPKAIGNLTSLNRLSGIKMRADCNDADELSIGDLEKLDLLRGNLHVEMRGNGIDWDEAKRARLHNKIHLNGMDIWICSPQIEKEEVLPALNPPSSWHVVLKDYKTWLENLRMKSRIKEKIRIAALVQKAALQYI